MAHRHQNRRRGQNVGKADYAEKKRLKGLLRDKDALGDAERIFDACKSLVLLQKGRNMAVHRTVGRGRYIEEGYINFFSNFEDGDYRDGDIEISFHRGIRHRMYKPGDFHDTRVVDGRLDIMVRSHGGVVFKATRWYGEGPDKACVDEYAPGEWENRILMLSESRRN